MSREEIRDVATLLATLILMPLIVHMLHAPFRATLAVAIVCWPIAWTGGIILIIEGSKRNERR